MKLPQLYDIFRDEWEQYSDIHLISDTHFDDKELYVGTKHIIRANSEDYVKLINSKAGRNSVLIHLGDVGNIEPISKLKAAHKVLICGNHDAGASNYKRDIIKEVYDASEYTKHEVLANMQERFPGYHVEVSQPTYDGIGSVYFIAIADNHLFDRVYEGPLIIGEKIILSHEPIHGLDCMMNIHGHVHDPKAKDNAHHLNICPDATGKFEPVHFGALLKSGFTSHIETIHRSTIDRATKRKKGKK